MKKLFCLLILLIFAGIVFFTGWTQIKVKPDTIGVIRSKTGGVNESPVIPGQFSWHKEFLLPTNAVMTSFSMKPQICQKKITGKSTFKSLQDSYLYDLDYSFDFSIALAYSPEYIIELLKNNTITNEDDLLNYLSVNADSICQMASAYYMQKYQEDSTFNPNSIKTKEVLRYVQPDANLSEIDMALTNYSIQMRLVNSDVNPVPEVKTDSALTDTKTTQIPQNAETKAQ